ncbi:GL14610 [Drosophila persimilis]|uniref:GL14610 n=1 Tax=Drosophila persimilis TaxID=7234 RepID=B4GVS5_DROPE|nr:GL14610 [Drosophila persimilis]
MQMQIQMVYPCDDQTTATVQRLNRNGHQCQLNSRAEQSPNFNPMSIPMPIPMPIPIPILILIRPTPTSLAVNKSTLCL